MIDEEFGLVLASLRHEQALIRFFYGKESEASGKKGKEIFT